MNRKQRWIASVVVAGCLVPTAASANAGLPMLYIVWPASLLLFLPVVALEGLLARRVLAVGLGRSFSLAAVANAASTLAGIPLAWFVLVLAEMLLTGGGRAYGVSTWSGKFIAAVVQAPWLIPYEVDLYWLIPATCISLCVPFYLVSAVTEGWIGRFVVRDRSADLRRWSWVANSISYAAIILLLVAWLGISILEHR